MKQNMLNKKRNLKPGEIVSLHYDQAFKIMYANPDHIEILTMLLSTLLLQHALLKQLMQCSKILLQKSYRGILWAILT